MFSLIFCATFKLMTAFFLSYSPPELPVSPHIDHVTLNIVHTLSPELPWQLPPFVHCRTCKRMIGDG